MIVCPGLNNDGLGNQLFRFATGLAHAAKLNTTFDFQWDRLKYIQNWNPYLKEVKNPSVVKNQFQEQSDFTFQELPLIDDLELHGYFQSENYFIEQSDLIRSTFQIKRSKINKGAIHVRRGDYLLIPDILPVLDRQYYERAIILANWTWGIKEWDIYSDDPVWCSNNFIGHEFNIVSNNEYEDFADIQNHEAIIMANSTFSWWCSWLSGHNRIIAPELWFAKGYSVKSDNIVPDRWRKV